MPWSMKVPASWKRASRSAPPTSMVYLTGYGFPLHRGGPMHYANEVGLGEVVAAMRRFGWEPARSLVK